MLRPINQLLFFLFLLLPIKGFAQVDKVYFEEYGTKEGLSEAAILSLTQDELGFTWFTTFNGLARYDGYEFEPFGIYHEMAMEGSLQLDINDILAPKNGQHWL